ncbi:hypothetical protein [Rubritepida flocculans]|uniref:hypothetical protein n=1 Tax=Rubritepida flocculans TaxID=182403 RepID=UPI00041D0A75|nr:hypothetical protein [Rubritepida flocculans]
MPSEDSFLRDDLAFTAQDGQWSTLTEELQLALAREALRRAAETLAEHAELLALEMETGALRDQGGPEALRLFAAVVRTTTEDGLGPVGHA